MLKWYRIPEQPIPGARVLVFTPVVGELRFRLATSDHLGMMGNATHWAYLHGPADQYVELPSHNTL